MERGLNLQRSGDDDVAKKMLKMMELKDKERLRRMRSVEDEC